jgi:hypothetical protein
VNPHFAVLPLVLAVRAVRDPRCQVPHVGLRYGVVVCEHEASPAVPHVAPPGPVEVDVTCEDDVVELGGCRLQLVPDPGQGRVLLEQVGPLPVYAAYQKASRFLLRSGLFLLLLLRGISRFFPDLPILRPRRMSRNPGA